jgi:AcrR family transcriptional regulator
MVARKVICMALELFYELKEEKKDRIMFAALSEFSQYSYSESSTNRIVKKAGIGKGSLFMYFKNKEDLYFEVIDYVIKDMSKCIDEEIKQLPNELFEKVIKYADIEISWYIKNPYSYKLLKRVFVDDNSSIYHKTIERYGSLVMTYYYELFNDLDEENLKGDKFKTLNILKWFLEGFNQEFIKEMEHNENIEALKEQYLKRLKEYLALLETGLLI